MESPPRRQNFTKTRQWYEISGQGGSISPNYRLVILCLGLLNAALLITAVVIGVKCVKVKEGSLHVSHSAVAQLISELKYLQSNHSDVIQAEEEVKKQLETAIKNHAQLKVQIEQQKIINDGYQRQIEALHTEKTKLQTNISALEGTCGRCLPGWTIFNSSCYFFPPSGDKKNWPDSRVDCKNRGADLVVIDNQQEQIFVSNSIQHRETSRNWWENGFWLGLTDTEVEGVWSWINNVTEVEQRYWMDGEPNNSGHTGEDCADALYSSSNPWKTRNDANCLKSMLAWICEMPPR
ncbi:hypothetical protein PAMA_003741 [Pampus argenteus]